MCVKKLSPRACGESVRFYAENTGKNPRIKAHKSPFCPKTKAYYETMSIPTDGI